MKLYQEKLQKYQTAKEALEKAEETYKKAQETYKEAQEVLSQEKEELSKYIEEKIFSKGYEIGNKKLQNGYKLYYPILNIVKGFELEKEKFDFDDIGTYDEPCYIIKHEYTLVNKETNSSIYISEQSRKRDVRYVNENFYLIIKNKLKDGILVMDNFITYKIKIANIEIEFKRNFKGTVTNELLTDILKEKYICYNDFKKGIPIRERTVGYCQNFLLDIRPDWKKFFTEYLEENVGKCEIEKIVSDIEENLIQITSSNFIKKSYYLNEEISLRVVLAEKDTSHICIFYEDEQLNLEMPVPVRFIELNTAIVNKPYYKEKEYHVKQEDIKIENCFTIRMSEDFDMDKKMYLLDILEKYKKKDK